VQATVERKRLQQEAEDEALLQTVFDGLRYTDGITGAARETLSRARKVEEERKRRLYAAWDAEVYQKLTDRIQRAVTARSVRDIEARLQHNAQACSLEMQPLLHYACACTAAKGQTTPSQLLRSTYQYHCQRLHAHGK
jgi:polyribonucleotide nucleotidyltransferase